MNNSPLAVSLRAFIISISLPCLFSDALAQRNGTPTGSTAPALAPATRDDSGWVAKTLASLTLERKIGQLMSTDLVGGYVSDADPRMLRWIQLAYEQGLGMFVFYGGTPRDVVHLLNRLQKEAKVPILMAADFEGGPG